MFHLNAFLFSVDSPLPRERQRQEATGLPAGIQIMSPNWEDATPVTFAGLLSRELGGFVRPPGFTK